MSNGYDSDYQVFKKDQISKKKIVKKHTTQNWKKISTIDNTYLERYLDVQIREKRWLYKAEYSTSTYNVLRCAEGPQCNYKRKIIFKEMNEELPKEHYLFEISSKIFSGKAQLLTLKENDQPHSDDYYTKTLEEKSKKG